MMKTHLTSTAALIVGLTLLATATPAFAQALGVTGSVGVSVTTPGVAASTSVSARVDAREAALMVKGKERADQELTRRIDVLTKLETRTNDMKRLSDSEKSSLGATIIAHINTLTELKAKIDADTSTTTLKDDVQSITKAYRIFALIVPQTAIAAAVDRVESIVATATDISAKLSLRISAASAAGHDTTTVNASLTDMNAKIADAKIQAEGALSATAQLQPDNGDKAVMAANTAALKGARAKIQAAQTDLKAAKNDAESIAKTLKTWSLQAQINASTTSSN